MHRASLLIFAVLLGGFLDGCGRSTARENVLRVGMELAYPPFEMADERGEPAGVSVDLAHELGRCLHRPTVISNIPFDGLIPALKTGKIDLVISSMTATPDRALSIDFSQPYLLTGLALLAGKQSDVRSIEDLKKPGRTVAVKANTTGQIYALEHLPSAHVLVLDQEASCVLEVVQGKADAFIYDQLSALRNARRYPDTLRPLLQPFQTEEWAIGVRKGEPELLAGVNECLAAFRREGGFDRLGDRWLKDEKHAFAKLGVPFVF